jgi:type I restriction enzyme M protein
MEEIVENILSKIAELNLDNQIVQISFDADRGIGSVLYNPQIKQHRDVRNFKGKEEIVRAYLISRLTKVLDYEPRYIELEKEYNIGRPKVKKARIDVILKDSANNIFFFTEVKAPDKWESDQEFIEGQLYQLAKLESRHIKYLVYYSIKEVDNVINDRAIIINYEQYDTFEKWDEAGQPSIGSDLTAQYGKPRKTPLSKGGINDLNINLSGEDLIALRKNLHKFLWGGGGTDDNEIFSSLVNIILTKIHDESKTEENQEYGFQVFVFGEDKPELENSERVYERINEIYKNALEQKLNLSRVDVETANIIDKRKFGLNKLLYTIQQLESISFVEGRNNFNGRDILGDFFEGIIREGFKQSKGQFFTPINIVRFIIYALKIDDLSIDLMNNENRLPYIVDPSVGSGTFLIEVMKIITNTIKTLRKDDLIRNDLVRDIVQELFMPDRRENKWAREYLYGLDINFNLGTATKVNMILHGDGSTNIFVGEKKGDGLLPFRFYYKEVEPNHLNKSFIDPNYSNLEVNGNFDVVISNPPFSVDLEKETKRLVRNEFLFSDKRNSENLFIERWYQLLKPGGRLGVVLPESVFDTTENKYIRLFLFKYFWIKAIVSIPQVTFEPYTQTKTTLLFAKKKKPQEIIEWNSLWSDYSSTFRSLKTKVNNYVDVYLYGKDRTLLPSIVDDDDVLEKTNILKYLQDRIQPEDNSFDVTHLLEKYKTTISEIGIRKNNDWVNETWVFKEISKNYNDPIFMAEAENVGYKRTTRNERKMPNDLFREVENKIELSTNVHKILNDLRKEVTW